MKETDLSWVAGIIDGEGAVTINIDNYKRPNNVPRLYAEISITNRDVQIISKYISIVEQLVKHKLYPTYHKPKKDNHSDTWSVRLTKMDDLRMIIGYIKPYLAGKLRQCNLIIDFLNVKHIENASVSAQLVIRDNVSCMNKEVIRVINPRDLFRPTKLERWL